MEWNLMMLGFGVEFEFEFGFHWMLTGIHHLGWYRLLICQDEAG